MRPNRRPKSKKMNDPYKILGVSQNATDDEIKKAYRNLARKYHPDNFAGSAMAELAEEKMKQLNEAISDEYVTKITNGVVDSIGHYNTEADHARLMIWDIIRKIDEIIIAQSSCGNWSL